MSLYHQGCVFHKELGVRDQSLVLFNLELGESWERRETRVYTKGPTTFARRSKACVFSL